MIKACTATFAALFLCLNIFAQTIHCDSQVVLENQKNQDVVAVNRLWNDYLASSPDSLYDNKLWNKAEKEKYKSYDLLRSEGGLELYSLAKNIGVVKNLVLSIKPVDDKSYDIHSMFYWVYPDCPPFVLCTTHVLAFKDDSGRFVLGNWLPYYSRNWKTVNEGPITFHYQEYKRNDVKIRKAQEFLAFLNKKFDVMIDHLDIYISKGFRETQRLKGFGYDIGEAAVSDTTDLGGTTDIDNNIIYSNSTAGEYYQHEMMRLVMPRYRGAHPLLMNGLSEYYSETLEMRGVSFREHFKNLDAFLDSHPEINLDKFDHFDSGNLTESNYLIGLVLVKMIEDKCGHPKFLEALDAVHTDEDLLAFMDRELGIKAVEADSVLRKMIKYYATEGYIGKQWR